MAQLFGHIKLRFRLLLVALALAFLNACHKGEAPTSSTRLANHGLLSAVVSPSGKHLFTGSFQHGGALWDLNSNARLFDWNHTTDDYSAYNAADFSESGRYLAATDGVSVVLWDTQTGEAGLFLESPSQSLGIQNSSEIWQTSSSDASDYWQKPARIVALALSKQYLLLGLENQVALLINISDQSIIGALGHKDVITDVAMDDGAEIAVIGSRDGSVTLWSLQDGTRLTELNYPTNIAHVELSPDGSQMITAAEKGPVLLHKLSGTGKPTAFLELFKGNPGIISTHFSAGNSVILGSSRELVWEMNREDGSILRTWKVPKQGQWHKAAIMAVHSRSNDIQAIASDGYAYQLN